MERQEVKRDKSARSFHINFPFVAFPVVEWTSNAKRAAINFANRSYARSFVIYLEVAAPINAARQKIVYRNVYITLP